MPSGLKSLQAFNIWIISMSVGLSVILSCLHSKCNILSSDSNGN